MILQKEKKDFSIMLSNLDTLPAAMDPYNLACLYRDMVLYSKGNFIITLPFDLKKTASKATSVKHVCFSQLETIVDAAERACLIKQIDGKAVIPYNLVVQNDINGFKYTIKYFDGWLQSSREYTQKEIYSHPRLMRNREAKPDE